LAGPGTGSGDRRLDGSGGRSRAFSPKAHRRGSFRDPASPRNRRLERLARSQSDDPPGPERGEPGWREPHASLRWANLSYAALDGSSLSGGDLSEANLSQANLAGTTLSAANLSRATSLRQASA